MRGIYTAWHQTEVQKEIRRDTCSNETNRTSSHARRRWCAEIYVHKGTVDSRANRWCSAWSPGPVNKHLFTRSNSCSKTKRNIIFSSKSYWTIPEFLRNNDTELSIWYRIMIKNRVFLCKIRLILTINSWTIGTYDGIFYWGCKRRANNRFLIRILVAFVCRGK